MYVINNTLLYTSNLPEIIDQMSEDEAEHTLRTAFEAGYRHIDCAAICGYAVTCLASQD
jgi:diketogulonate reductase-like aldo/keto reductase